MVKEHPNIPALDIMKEVGRIWQNITKEELDYFKQKSKEDMQRYLSEHEKFINEINDMRAKCKSSSPGHPNDNADSFPEELLLGLMQIDDSNHEEYTPP